jgi:hypothetical protein
LDGFPGVYIGTAAEVVGQLYDTRDLSTAPSFRNFVHKPAEELQQLLITAIEEQKRQLQQRSQAPSSTQSGTAPATTSTTSSTTDPNSNDAIIKDLDAMLKWTRKVNTTKADKDALTVLKAHGLKL